MLYSLTVMKDEQARYLERALAKLVCEVDGAYVYDDGSIDGSVAVAEEAGATVGVRAEMSPTFLDDECKFRSDALRNMVQDLNVQLGDWIVVIDADEVLIADRPIKEIVDELDQQSYSLKINEVFSIGDVGETPYIRTDGFWGKIHGARLFRFDGDYEFAQRQMGCGSVPEKFLRAPMLDDIEILHYGYAAEEDRVQKYARYFGRPGHSVQHIDSILRSPVLVRWDGKRL